MKGGFHFYRGGGQAAARYFDEGHKGAEAYYTEDARVAVQIDTWQGGHRVGTATLAEAGDLVRWVEGVDPLTGEVKGIIRTGGPERQPLRFIETVVNNPKSLSIVASQNPQVAEALDRTLARQADEVARYMSQVAVTRIGPKGGQRDVGGLRVETARVTHLTSREGDPHRHVHLMLNTRVMAPDGTWRGLHSAALRQHIGAVQRVGERVLLTDPDLRRTLARHGYTLGVDGEIDQARDAVALLSKRSAQVAERRAALEAAWRAKYPDREPSQRTVNGWDRAAWEKTRKAKSAERETPEQLSARIRAELADAGFDFTPGAHRAVALHEISVADVDRDLVADEALAVLSGKRSAWSKAELTAEVEAAVVRTGVTGPGEAVGELVEDCHARALERCRSVLDPERHAPTAMSRHLTSDQVVDSDRALHAGLATLAGGGGARDHGAYALARDRGLGTGQAEAAAAVAGHRRLEVVVGPAGAGKTTMLSVARDRLETEGRTMVVVAPTRKGAMVAARELGAEGSSLSKLLYAHGWRWDDLGRWTRLDPGQVDPVTGEVAGPRPTALDARSVIVVDEAALTTVDQGAALIELATETGAALRLVGDPRQLGAVGRGGVMEAAARWAADPVTLDEVHRFVWVGLDGDGLPVTEPDRAYAALTLAMREGEDPFSVADEMVARGMVVVHATEDEALAAVAAEATRAAEAPGELATTVATNAQALAVNEAVRAQRVAAGLVDDRRVAVGMDGVRIGAGDRITTRRNDPDLGVANRECWRVQEIRRGAVVAEEAGRRVTLPAGYVARSVQLGYATTDYGVQGTTAARSVTLAGEATTAGGLYVAATRGRYDNTVHVVAPDMDGARDQLTAALYRDRADRGLEAARQRAEREAVAVPEPPIGRPAVDVATWTSAAELDRRAESIERRRRDALRATEPQPVMDEAAWRAATMKDRQAAAAARERAAGHRAAAARMEAGRPDLVAAATDDYFDAREAAQRIEEGPGRFRRHAGRVADADALRRELAARWFGHQLPGAAWRDETVRSAAAQAVDRTLARTVGDHHRAAVQEERRAARLDDDAAARDDQQHDLRRDNDVRATRRQQLMAPIDQDRDDLDHDRAVRDERTAAMTPEEIGTADAARDGYLAAETIARLVEAGVAPGRDAPGRSFEPPTMEPPELGLEGPGLEL